MRPAPALLLLATALLPGCAVLCPRPEPVAAPVSAPAPTVDVLVDLAVAEGAGADAVAAAQDAVLTALPAGRVTVLRRLRLLPQMALSIDPALLPTLLAHPAVVAVRADRDRPLAR